MRDAKFMEMTSLILLLLVVLLSPVIILLVKNATSTIQVDWFPRRQKADEIFFIDF